MIHIIIVILTVIAILIVTVFFFMQQPVFGALPSGENLERIKKSTQYQNGAFQNQSPTPMMSEGVSYGKLLMDFFKKRENTKPPFAMPSVKTDLTKVVSQNPVITWFGHSSYLLQTEGKNILVDPVLSEYASPLKLKASKCFDGASVYSVNDMPAIDVVLLTHDHYDHLDYMTIVHLKNKARAFVVPLGVAAHLEKWEVDKTKITELDWGQTHSVSDSIHLTVAPARHFSGRGFKRAQSLWVSYIIQAGKHKLYIAGDSGYDTHYKKIGDEFGPFDIAILECGQYNTYWPYIHQFPEQTAQAAIDVKAKVLFPVHWGKFVLAMHNWNEPPKRVSKKATELNMPVTIPMIGEQIIVGEKYPDNKWWDQ